MKGDFYRYLSEHSTGVMRDNYEEKAIEAYTYAVEQANKMGSRMSLLHEISFNFANFHYEVKNDPVAAFKTARGPFEKMKPLHDDFEEDR